MKPLQGSNQRREETHWLVVLWFKRDLGDRHAASTQPLGQCGGFPKTGRRRNQGQGGIAFPLEALKQVRALDELFSQAGNIHNGREVGKIPSTRSFGWA